MHPSMCTMGMLSCAAAKQPITVFVAPRNTAASGAISRRTGARRAITAEEISASVSPPAPSSMSGGATPRSRKNTSFMLSE